MQELEVKVRGADGEETMKKVKVIRSFSQGDRALFLFAGGLYGYKDGSPVQSKKELSEIITCPHALRAALAWWEDKGKNISKAFYEERDRELARRAGDFRAAESVPESERDRALYRRRAAGSEKWGEPLSWDQFFPERPDWWAQAQTISFNEYEYQLDVSGPAGR